MNGFLRGLILDLRNKCNLLGDMLRGSLPSVDVTTLSSQTLLRISYIEAALTRQLDRLDSPAASYSTPNIFIEYKERSNEITFYEQVCIPTIVRFNDDDKLFNRMIRLACTQIGYPIVYPTGSVLGNQYYHCYPQIDLIVGPLLQAHSLLSLPDLFHELGHCLYLRYESYFRDPFLNQTKIYFEQMANQLTRQGSATSLISILKDVREKWETDWLIEFCCDMIATYLVGNAYGWANLHLCANAHPDSNIYLPTAEQLQANRHPSDEARMKGICSMLILLNDQRGVETLLKDWRSYETIVIAPKPDHYDFFYPEKLIDELARLVNQQCQNIGLMPYSGQRPVASGINLIVIIRTAWSEFLKDPQSYVGWEKLRLAELKRIVLT